MEELDKVKIIGITGIIGSGKSSVANYISEMGYPVLSSDKNAKIIMAENKNIQQKIIDLFGKDAYTDNKLNSSFIANKVFGREKENKSNLEKLNNIVHPAVIDYNMTEIEKLIENGEELIFVESALIFELGLEDGYDYVINVDCPIETAINRTMERSNLSKSEVEERMKNQLHANEKKKFADFTIDNSKGLDDLKNSTEFIVSLIKDLPCKDFDNIDDSNEISNEDSKDNPKNDNDN